MNHPSRYPSYAPTSPSRIPASSAVSPNAYPDEDWTKISDLSERRRIQNRIAQRNYRQKMKLRSEGKAPASPLDRSQRRSRASQDRDTAASRHKSTAGKASPDTTQHAQECRSVSYHGDVQGPTYASPGIDNTYHASTPESYPYSQSAQPALYTTTEYADYSQYSDIPEYYTESSLEPSQYSTADQRFYDTSGPMSYDLNHGPSDLNAQFTHSDVYLSAQPYPYEMIVPDGHFADQQFLHPHGPRY